MLLNTRQRFLTILVVLKENAPVLCQRRKFENRILPCTYLMWFLAISFVQRVAPLCKKKYSHYQRKLSIINLVASLPRRLSEKLERLVCRVGTLNTFFSLDENEYVRKKIFSSCGGITIVHHFFVLTSLSASSIAIYSILAKYALTCPREIRWMLISSLVLRRQALAHEICRCLWRKYL